MAYNPPIGNIYHIYTTYILPSEGVYNPYHPLQEPEKSIDHVRVLNLARVGFFPSSGFNAGGLELNHGSDITSKAMYHRIEQVGGDVGVFVISKSMDLFFAVMKSTTMKFLQQIRLQKTFFRNICTSHMGWLQKWYHEIQFNFFVKSFIPSLCEAILRSLRLSGWPRKANEEEGDGISQDQLIGHLHSPKQT